MDFYNFEKLHKLNIQHEFKTSNERYRIIRQKYLVKHRKMWNFIAETIRQQQSVQQIGYLKLIYITHIAQESDEIANSCYAC